MKKKKMFFRDFFRFFNEEITPMARHILNLQFLPKVHFFISKCSEELADSEYREVKG